MNHGGGGHHMRMFMPRGLMFMFMRRGQKPVSPQYKGRQARVEAALQSLAVKTVQQKYWEAQNERKATYADLDPTRGSGSMDGVGPSVLAQPEISGADSVGAGRDADGGSGPAIVIGNEPNWETLEAKLLALTKDNPDIQEVELKKED